MVITMVMVIMMLMVITMVMVIIVLMVMIMLMVITMVMVIIILIVMIGFFRFLFVWMGGVEFDVANCKYTHASNITMVHYQVAVFRIWFLGGEN